MTGSPPRNKARLSFAEHITVLVGPDKQKFMVYKEEICAHSEFFKVACSGRWTRATGDEQPKAIELLDEQPEIFDTYLYCVYKNEVDLGDLDNVLTGEASLSKDDREQHRLVEAYLLADKLLDLTSANVIIDKLIQSYVDKYQSRSIFLRLHACTLIANNTTPDSPLWQFAVDCLCKDGYLYALQEYCLCEDFPRSFIYGLLQAQTEAHRTPKERSPWDVSFYTIGASRCRYHQHNALHPSCGKNCEKSEEAKVTPTSLKAKIANAKLQLGRATVGSSD